MITLDLNIMFKDLFDLNFAMYFADIIIEVFPNFKDSFNHYITNFDFYYKNRFNDDIKDTINSIIQNDLLDDFISYIQKNETDLSTELSFMTDFYDPKLYNLGESHNLINCAAYFGSSQIFQYLINNGFEATQKTMHYSIYGQNLEIIHILEKANIKPDKESYEISIKCHHNEIKDYIKNNYFKDDDNFDNNFLTSIFNYYNYSCIEIDFITESNFFNFCKYDYIYFADFLLQTEKLNLNSKFEKKTKIKDKKKVTSKTPLYISIQKHNFEITKLLLEQKDIDVNVICSKIMKENEQIIQKSLNTSVNVAMCANNDEIIELILANPNIDVNLRVSEYRYGILVSSQSISDLSIVKEEKKEYSYIFEALIDNYSKVVQILLSNPKIDVNAIMKFWYKNDRNESQNIEIPLLFFVNDANIKFLVEHPQIKINAPMIKSIYYNSNDEQILKKYDEYSLLMDSITSKNTDLVRLLMSNKDIDCNSKLIYRKRVDNEKFEEEIMTPLYNAVKVKSTDIVEILLSNPKIDVNEKSSLIINDYLNDIKKEYTALHMAIDSEDVEILKILLSNHLIDVNTLMYDSISRVPNENELPKPSKIRKTRKTRKMEENSSSSEEKSSSSSEDESSSSSEEENKEYEYYSYSEYDEDDEKEINKLKNSKIYSETKEFTALQMCLDKNKIDIFNLLISHDGIDLNIRSIYENKNKTNTKTENTILYASVEKGNSDFVKHLLMKKEIDINKKSISTFISPKETSSALSYIYHMGEEIKTIKEKTPLSIAILNDNNEIFQLLLSNPNIDVNSKCIESTESQSEDTKKEFTPLLYAINNDNENLIEKLLSNSKIDVNILLTESSYIEDVDENKKFLSNLKKLVSIANNENNDDEDVKKIEKKLAEKKEFNALHYAVENNKVQITNLLLNHADIDVNIKSIYYQNKSDILKKEQTALHISIENEKRDMICLLLSKKETDINSVFYSDLRCCTNYLENKKYTPLHMAVEKSNVFIVGLLLSRPEIDVNYLAYLSKGRAEKDSEEISSLEKYTQTALYMAVYNHHSKIVNLLLHRNDIDVNIHLEILMDMKGILLIRHLQ